MSPGLLQAPPRSVLLVRLSARGDIVFSSPLIRALRRTYPQARLTWMAESHTRDLVEHHPELDELIVVDRNGWKKLWRQRRFGDLFREVEKLLLLLRSRHFDVAIDLQGLLRSGIMTYLSGAPVRLGLGSKEGSGALMTRVLPRDRGDVRQVSSEYRYLAEVLGLDVGEFAMEVPLAPGDREWALGVVDELGLENGFCAAIPFTTRPQKHWFEDRWAHLMDRISEELGLPVVVLGGPGDEAAFRRIRERVRTHPESLVGKTTLTRAGAMIQRASLVVGVDTGLTHMGIAFQRPTVAIFGSTIPYSETPTNRAKVVVHRLDCSPCKGNPTCNGAFTCLQLVTADEVMAAAREVMAAAQEGVAAALEAVAAAREVMAAEAGKPPSGARLP
jgi:heptosyltransferase I